MFQGKLHPLLIFRVQQIAKKIGEELWNVGDSITKRSEMQEVRKKNNCLFFVHASFNSRANVA